MAKLSLSVAKEGKPPLLEELEVRVWGPGGTEKQEFSIGSGGNFNAKYNIWLEIIHSINGAQVFYTRTFLHLHMEEGLGDALEKFRRGEIDTLCYADSLFSLPQTDILLEHKTFTDTFSGTNKTYEYYNFRLFADTGAVLTGDSPGSKGIEIKIEHIPLEPALDFMNQLDQELMRSLEGGPRPNPADLAPGSSTYPFARMLNQQAYDQIASDYQEDYFSNPTLAEMFEEFLKQLPGGGHILDAGCGHGDPVITRLLERGFQVTGSDFSPAMLKRARERFPQVQFLQHPITDIDEQNAYDAACSFNSILYQDPIDLLHSTYRLWRALKPGGLLFLFAYDTHPGWRGIPILNVIGQEMWSWCHSKEEAAQALEEHNFFKVLDIRDVTTEEERKGWIISRIKYEKEQEEKLAAMKNGEAPALEPVGVETPPGMPEISNLKELLEKALSNLPDDLPNGYAILARKVG